MTDKKLEYASKTDKQTDRHINGQINRRMDGQTVVGQKSVLFRGYSYKYYGVIHWLVTVN